MPALSNLQETNTKTAWGAKASQRMNFAKEDAADDLKLNEIIAAHQGASNRMVNIEDITETELDQLHKFYVRIAILAKQEDDLGCTHSIDAADDNHLYKSQNVKKRPARKLEKATDGDKSK